MANAVYIDIEGADELIRKFGVARRNKNRVLKQAMSDAAKKCASFVRGKTPSRWKSLVRGSAWINRRDTVSASFGASYKKNQFDWQKAYWLNYGTYSKRDTNHKYRYARKRGTADWGQGGSMNTKYYHFFEQAIQGFEPKFRTEFESALNRRIMKLFK